MAEGFERIHRSNLIGMGVLPLTFHPGATRITLGIDGTEVFEVRGVPSVGAVLTLRIQRRDGRVAEVPVTCRLDTAEEVSIYAVACCSVLRRIGWRLRPTRRNALDPRAVLIQCTA